ncbi:hypothetical protein L210DRAFT_2191943 [Boletus edulis BED1]|uniref:Uncharacterized protein n=1 Tax=Boletus edulis BED1 TaxID=1328754 RepID=A0AAD4GEI3_BOLED|nr:hypothetical protein L210DRAFT_2191943 [Boletus edulis BED1]
MSSYDQSLLHEAPKATRAQLQEGYNVDLLAEQPVRRTPSMRNPPPSQSPQPPPVPVPLTPAIPEAGSGEKFGSPVYPPTAPKPRTSFWRTPVGGAVGGTIKKSNNKTVDTTGINSTSSVTSSSLTSTAGTQDIANPTSSKPTTSARPSSPTQTGQNTGGQQVQGAK